MDSKKNFSSWLLTMKLRRIFRKDLQHINKQMQRESNEQAMYSIEHQHEKVSGCKKRIEQLQKQKTGLFIAMVKNR